jgi:radical SAM additional 4Fe4S-binding domain
MENGNLNLFSVPQFGPPISSLDLDLTTRCNLNCRYCYKDRGTNEMPDRVAFDAVVWLIQASGNNDVISINFMGGEPLLRFDLVKKVVPFAKRRSGYHGKRVYIGTTTNCTVLNDEILNFWKMWGLSFHTSIDGSPLIQDYNRPTARGTGSSLLVEQNVPKILEYRKNTTARCTVTSETVHAYFDNYTYFRSLGYHSIAMVPSEIQEWSLENVRQYEEQLQRVMEDVISQYRLGVCVSHKELSDYCSTLSVASRRTISCGAGRNMVAIDCHGNIWPCSRWTNGNFTEWKLGNIYDGFKDEVRRCFLEGMPGQYIETQCEGCKACGICSCSCMADNLKHRGDIFEMHTNQCLINKIQSRIGGVFHDTLYSEKCPTFMAKYHANEWNMINKYKSTLDDGVEYDNCSA